MVGFNDSSVTLTKSYGVVWYTTMKNMPRAPKGIITYSVVMFRTLSSDVAVEITCGASVEMTRIIDHSTCCSKKRHGHKPDKDVFIL
jgi:hypothetical protein